MSSEVQNLLLTKLVTLTILVAMVVLATLVGTRWLFAPLPGKVSSVVCSTGDSVEQTTVESTSVTVDVYNASKVSGLANRTLDQLVARGFKAGKVANAPSGTDVTTVVVHAADTEDPRAMLVAQQFGPDTKIQKDAEAAGIEVYVGKDSPGVSAAAPTELSGKLKKVVCK